MKTKSIFKTLPFWLGIGVLANAITEFYLGFSIEVTDIETIYNIDWSSGTQAIMGLLMILSRYFTYLPVSGSSTEILYNNDGNLEVVANYYKKRNYLIIATAITLFFIVVLAIESLIM